MPIRPFQGKIPKIHPSVYVAPSALIVGDVIIGEGSSVWPNAVIRGDTDTITIGRHTNIQDHVTVHADHNIPTKIGDHVTAGHAAIIHGATVGDYVIVGINAAVLNRSRVGDYSIVGAGAVVVEGSEIPEGSLAVGIPAKVLRKIDEENRKRIAASADAYHQLSRSYLEEKIL